jgi:hypothetical protein
MKHSFIAFTAMLLFICCAQKSEIPARPAADQSTPDKAVKSFWLDSEWWANCCNRSYLDYLKGFPFYSAQTLSHEEAKVGSLLAGHSLNQKNKIEKVDVQSDSRAIVWTSEYRFVGAEKVDTVQNILTKENRLWVIEDRLMHCIICDGKGRVDDLDQMMNKLESGVLSNATKPCPYCKGTGWRSLLF